MESDFQQHHYNAHDHRLGHREMSSGLTRYQSAPSSYFSSFTDRELLEEFLHRPTSPETEQILSGFLQTNDGSNNVDGFLHQTFSGQNSSSNLWEKKPLGAKIEQEMNDSADMEDDQDGDASVMHPEMIHYATLVSRSSNRIERQQEKIDGSRNHSSVSNLARHNSSPAGLFSSIDVESAYAVLTNDAGNFGSGNHLMINKKEAMDLTPRSRHQHASSSSKSISSISETDVKPVLSSGRPPRTLSGSLTRNKSSDFSKLTGLSRTVSRDQNLFKTKEGNAAKRPPLAHHLSLPKSLSDIEKILSDSVQCKIRAKRGCATHPRSIAERVRRTKISERMKKLQDLVPNMDKQTNTSDMLDFAVQYIKDLQEQIKELEENRARCTCCSAWSRPEAST